MRTAYFFSITNSKKYYYTLFANILLLVNFAIFSFIKYQLYYNHTCTVFSCIVLPNTILAIFLVRLFFVFTKRKLAFTNFHFALVAAAGWLGIQQWIAAAVILVLGLIEYIVNRDLYCITDKNGVTITSFPKRSYLWKEVNNVLMKDGIFTIDQKNNRILQLDISEEIIPFTEEAYNSFVKEQLINA
jgi:hypothetical protein